jgi:RNA polymerase sigma-70 factor (ECF subfamily)
VVDDDIRRFIDDGYAKVVGTVAVVCGSRAAAEDAVQEAIVRAWQRSERGERIERLDAWVATVALNLSRSSLRRIRAERRARGRLPDLIPVTNGPTSDAVDLHRALTALPARQREAIVLRGFLELRVDEIARVMGTSEGTVKSQLAKARASLSSALSVGSSGDGTSPEKSDVDA